MIMSTETQNKSFFRKGIRPLLMGLGLATALFGYGSTALAASTDLELTAEPLFMRQVTARPSLVLDLSVEFPTVGAAYRGTTYNASTEYIGYFNQYKCYTYDKTKRYFVLSGDAAGFKCSRSADFSGNFLNWATSSSIDILRYSLTGGDRIEDTPGHTVLQRAVLLENFYNNNSNFPAKVLKAAQVTDNVPDALKKDGTNGTHNGDIYIYNCLDKVYFRKNAGSCNSIAIDGNVLGSSLSGAAHFFVRTEVCAANGFGGVADVRKIEGKVIPYCYQYSQGYKPIGKLQQNSEQLRVAAFGYPLISSKHPTNSYHAVLRAPMKYLGPVHYDDDYKIVTGADALNPKREWDPDSGVFINNPEGDGTYPVSGVINYLNRFGRMGIPGTYKGNDQTAYLYYESLRYLQGLKPTPNAKAAVDAAGASAYDGFPITFNWVDPHPKLSDEITGKNNDYSCFKNNIITIGDIHTHQDTFIPGFTHGGISRGSNISRNIPNFYQWTKVVRGFEHDDSIDYKDAEGNNRNTKGWNPNINTWEGAVNLEDRATGSDNSRFTIAGMAYWANTHDIRGVDVTKKPNAVEKWTDFSEALTSDPVRPGMRVRSFFIDVNEINNSDSAVKRDSNQYRFGAKYGGFDADRSFDGSNPYSTDGNKANRTNSLWLRGSMTERFPTNYFLASDSVAMVKAFDYIFESILKDTSFVIAGVGSSSGYASLIRHGDILFEASFSTSAWSGNLSASVVNVTSSGALDNRLIADWSPAAILDDMSDDAAKIKGRKIFVGQGGSANAVKFDGDAGLSLTTDQIDFLRGLDVNEGILFRNRVSILGDIINSYPVYKGEPSKIGYDLAYQNFYKLNKNRTPAVYVGANDGMLHAFDASFSNTNAPIGNSGSELFAYIPSFVVPNLSKLTEKDYKHQAYMDGPLMVAEAGVGASWKTVLLGGAGGGGKGVFALDVTKPDDFKEDNLIWEFTEADSSEKIGNVMGAPVVARMSYKEGDDPATNKWYAFVPSGVNSATGSVGVFILDLSKSASSSWSKNQNYFWVPIPSISGRPQGIINIKVITDSRSNFKTLYVGDLSGQVTKVTIPHLKKGQNVIGDEISAGTGTRQLLFTAPKDQSISMPVSVFNFGQFTFVSFGTGKYIELADTEDKNFKQQALYTIVDSNSKVDISKLAQLKIDPATKEITSSITGLTWNTEDNVTGSDSARAGWYLNLPEVGSGERMIYQMNVLDGTVIANSMLPSRGGCSTGASTQYRFNMKTVTGQVYDLDNLFGGVYLIEGEPVFVVDPDTGNIKQEIQVNPGGPTTEGVKGADPIETSVPKARKNVREIYNYDKVRDSSFTPVGP